MGKHLEKDLFATLQKGDTTGDSGWKLVADHYETWHGGRKFVVLLDKTVHISSFLTIGKEADSTWHINPDNLLMETGSKDFSSNKARKNVVSTNDLLPLIRALYLSLKSDV